METRSGRKLGSANPRTAKALPLPLPAEETQSDARATALVSTVPPIAVSTQSTSACSRSSTTVRAKKLAAQTQHAYRLAQIEMEAAEARRAKLEAARKEYEAEIEAISSRGSRSGSRASDTQSGYSPIENLARLSYALRGIARETVDKLLVTARDPDIVMRALEVRFGRPDLIILQELYSVRSLPRYLKSQVGQCHMQVMYGNAEQSPSELVTQTSSVSTTTSCKPLLKIVTVTVSGPAGSVDTFALLDDGSKATFIDSEITSQIGVTGTVEQIELQCVGGLSKQSQVEYVDFQIKGKRSADSFVIEQARSISNLGLANRNVNKSDVLAFPYLLDIADELCYNVKPTIIIGIDNWNLSIPMAVRQGTSSQPVAILTVLGWVLFGFVANRTNAVHFVNNVCDYDLGSDKLRVVNNAVAKLGVSSNKLPLREPDLLKSFLNIVNRFHEESVIINDDIKAIYPQVKIHNVYCDAQRFTWRDSSKEPLKTYLMSSMIYGAASKYLLFYNQ
ncbi:uncharacterized protein LOC131841727 [Achroia grisella]|uniref:uncharacterized protein LOC131841727 n=1 Tax=Achroia grisella TaxID=688607 RepID=UPI0027D26522|nr:uncharacterized protein LOC131841727 [Achroia grisella]